MSSLLNKGFMCLRSFKEDLVSRPSYLQEVEVDKRVDEALARGDLSAARRIISENPKHTHFYTADKVGQAFIEADQFQVAESVARDHPKAYNTSFRIVERTMDRDGASAAIKKAVELDNNAGLIMIEGRCIDSGQLSERVLPEFLRSTTHAHASDLHWGLFDRGL